jgi:ISXO2-like transposase domain
LVHHALNRAVHTCEKHKTIRHKDGISVDGDITTSGIGSAFSLLRRSIIGTWRRLSAKHLAAYLDEMPFPFNNRKNPYLFRDTLLKLLSVPVLEDKELVAVNGSDMPAA